MTIPLFDIQSGFLGVERGKRNGVGREELLGEMARLSMHRALVRITPEDLDADFARSNGNLYAACATTPQLIPCPVAIPNTGGDLECEDQQVARAIKKGAGAVWIRPSIDSWTLHEWASGKLFSALQDRRLPVMCLERMVNLDQTTDLAARYPFLPIIFAETSYRSQRTLLAMLKRFQNIYLSTGSNYCVHKGIEQFVNEVGPERLVFGTGFPVAEPMNAVTLLMYADISEDAKRLIGAGNAENLIGAIIT